LSALTDKLEKAKTDEGSTTPATPAGDVSVLEEQVRKLEAQIMANKMKEKK